MASEARPHPPPFGGPPARVPRPKGERRAGKPGEAGRALVFLKVPAGAVLAAQLGRVGSGQGTLQALAAPSKAPGRGSGGRGLHTSTALRPLLLPAGALGLSRARTAPAPAPPGSWRPCGAPGRAARVQCSARAVSNFLVLPLTYFVEETSGGTGRTNGPCPSSPGAERPAVGTSQCPVEGFPEAPALRVCFTLSAAASASGRTVDEDRGVVDSRQTLF